MALSQRLEFRQTQALVMTPQLMQAIKLLQLSSLDLAAYVEGELESNPLLERASDDDDAPGHRRGGSRPAPTAAKASEEAAPTADWIGEDLETSRSSMEEGLGTELENVFPDDGGEKSAGAGSAAAGLFGMVGRAAAQRRRTTTTIWKPSSPPKPRSPIISPSRWRWPIPDPAGRMIGQYLIDMVDEAGYLTGDLDAVAEKLGAPLRRCRSRARRSCRRSIRPASARAISPNASPSSSRTATATIRPCARWSSISISWPSAISPRLRRLCGVNDEDLADMIAEIRNLNPKPGLAFGSTMVQPIVPDVLVRAAPDGTWQVELNSDTLPKVLINQRYYAQVSKTHAQRQGQDLSRRLPADRDLAGARARPARQDHPQSVERDRAPAGRLLRQGRAAFAAAQSQDRRRRHRHARVDRLARHRQQIHGDHARHLRAEIFLHLVDRVGRRRRGAFGRSGAPPHPPVDRRARPPPTCCPTIRSSTSCARPASTSRAAPSPNTAKPCASRPRCSAGARSRPPAENADRSGGALTFAEQSLA